MTTRYILPVLNITGGETVLTTIESYLGNDRNVEITAKRPRPPKHRPPAPRPLRGGHRPLTARNRERRRSLVGAPAATPQLSIRLDAWRADGLALPALAF
jgi:hypothetical protein